MIKVGEVYEIGYRPRIKKYVVIFADEENNVVTLMNAEGTVLKATEEELRRLPVAYLPHYEAGIQALGNM